MKKTHFDLKAHGFDFDLQPQALDMKMFLDQAFYIKNAIGSAMNMYENEEYTIVGHSIGCLIAMLIQTELI